MGERMARVETKLESIDSNIKELKKGQNAVLDEIRNMPEKFVLRKEFAEYKSKQSDKERNIKQKIWDVSMKVAPWLLLLMFLGLTVWRGWI